jgi:hypothetical protein
MRGRREKTEAIKRCSVASQRGMDTPSSIELRRTVLTQNVRTNLSKSFSWLVSFYRGALQRVHN